MPETVRMQPVDAVLLDMDGTIVNSIKSAERVWAAWARRHGLDVDAFLPTIHGVQSVETIRRLALPGVDAETEALAITRAEIEQAEGTAAIGGAGAFLDALSGMRWAVVTSAPRALALSRIAAAGLPAPPLLIAAEDVTHGKPAPDCFLLAAERLGVAADRCLVVEDSPAGILSGERAGGALLVITETHHTPMAVRHPAIRDYRDLTLERQPDGALVIAMGTAANDGLFGGGWAVRPASGDTIGQP